MFLQFWVKIQTYSKWTSFENSIHANHSGTNPSLISHSQPKIPILHSLNILLNFYPSVKRVSHMVEWDMKPDVYECTGMSMSVLGCL